LGGMVADKRDTRSLCRSPQRRRGSPKCPSLRKPCGECLGSGMAPWHTCSPSGIPSKLRARRSMIPAISGAPVGLAVRCDVASGLCRVACSSRVACYLAVSRHLVSCCCCVVVLCRHPAVELLLPAGCGCCWPSVAGVSPCPARHIVQSSEHHLSMPHGSWSSSRPTLTPRLTQVNKA